jgi:hypothetical protein
MNTSHIFQYYSPTPEKTKIYEKLRSAAKTYADALIAKRLPDEDSDLALEIAYEDYVRVVNELVPSDSPEYIQAIKYIDQAYDLAVDHKQAIVTNVQAASMFLNSAIALSPN